MQTPSTPAEQLFFTTLRIECSNPAGTSSGTGFVVLVPIEAGEDLLVLVTNRHVLQGASETRVIGAAALADGSRPNYGTKAVVVGKPPIWVAHPSPAIDVASLVLSGLPLAGPHQPFIKALPTALLLEEVEQQLDAIELVTFIGYPNSLHDTVNMTPIARRGWTATPVSLDYGGNPTFLIDASVFPGSSGSPVFILDVGGYASKGGGFVVGSRVHLLGILAAVHVQKTTGQIISAASTPSVQVDQMIDLGIVYKTRTVLETIDALVSSMGLRRAPSASVVPASVPVEPPPGSLGEAASP